MFNFSSEFSVLAAYSKALWSLDSKLFNSVDKDKFISFFKSIVENKQLDISVKYLRNILNKVLDGAVKEVKEIKDNVNLYIEKIVNDNRELIFMMVNLNA